MRRFVQFLLVVAALAVPGAAHATVGTIQTTTATIRTDLAIDLTPAPVATAASIDLCAGHRTPSAACALGNGRRTRGGGNKVSHLGWPAVTGILWIVHVGGGVDGGTPFNDELLGSHDNDFVSGGDGDDIVWGDQLPVGNNTWQHDVLDGGPGNDWIYSSHGRNDIFGSSGNDHIWGHFGHGTIDCGPGYDVVHVKRHPTYRLRNCEKVLHH